MSTPSTSDSSHERCLAVVTGSTSGIGKAIAVDLARRGFTVVVNGRSQASVDSAVADVKAASEAPLVLGAVGDLGTEAGCANFITDVEALSKQHELPINVLVNNMGIFETADFFSVPDSTWQHYIDVRRLPGTVVCVHGQQLHVCSCTDQLDAVPALMRAPAPRTSFLKRSC
jgi:NAD(P)-dependent dehydrogenase (short-subunit alcohol dehydrogenase family)